MDMDLKNTLEAALTEIVRREFDGVDLEGVHLEPDFDSDGEPIIKIRIVLTSIESFDAKKAKGITRHIFPTFREKIESSFPIVSFLSKSDYAKMSAAA